MSQCLNKFMIIDGNALLHRAWHALPQTMRSPSGKITNAAYGFFLILLRAIKDLRPSHLIVCFDAKGPTFRDKLYKEYKAHRKKKPQELYDQILIIQEILRAFGVKFYQKSGIEADDLIGTLVHETCNMKHETKLVIVTGDMDTLQLVDRQTSVYSLKKGISETLIYDINEVKKRYDGLVPNQLIDFKALRGDPSDNIPGAKGIGEKTAIKLLKKFGSVPEIYRQLKAQGQKNLSNKTGIRESIFQKLINSNKEVKLSQNLATIKQDVKIKFDLKNARLGQFNPEKIIKIFKKYGFRSLISQLHGISEMFNITTKNQATKSKSNYIFLDTNQKMQKFLKELKRQKEIVIDAETDGLDVVLSKPVGVSLCWCKDRAYYIDYKSLKPKFLTILQKILEDTNVKKIGHNLKFDYQVLKNIGINLCGIYFDTMIAAYLINPGKRVYSLDNLAFQYIGATMQKIEELIGPRGKQGQLNMGAVDPKRIAYYAAEDADFTWRLYQKFKTEINTRNLEQVFFKIEMPLLPILAQMEHAGIELDVAVLQNLGKRINADIKKLEQEIFNLAGQKFNIASPQQLKRILFNKLKLSAQGLRKTKTGISTAAPELEKMRGRHMIIDYIFNYRELSKLKSTYIDALPSLVNRKTGRIHTSFNQVITATGRLSSSNPNIQNIPVRTAQGSEIRKAFIAQRGYQLLSFDYSQIELRVAAHLSGDKNMIQTFNNGQDIHTATAARLFGIKITQVNKEQRRKAKEANFGVLYGLGPRGLSQRMKVSFEEAQDFIARYRFLYPQVFTFLQAVIERTRQIGYAQTLYGRRRYLPEINSGSPVVRAAAERAAINMPVQGTAADIIKMAMINIMEHGTWNMEQDSEIRMLLQVHDELVFEVKNKVVKKWASIIKGEMENAAKLKVPLKVDVKVGRNWKEMESALKL